VVAAEDLLGHAVRAAEVAPVGDRDAQVPQRAAEAVSHPTRRPAPSGTARIGRNDRPTTWHRDTSHPGATAHQDRRRAAAHQRSGQLDPGQPSKVPATAPTGAAMRRDMEDMVRRLAGAAGGQVELI
jgi:hypothetical protein